MKGAVAGYVKKVTQRITLTYLHMSNSDHRQRNMADTVNYYRF